MFAVAVVAATALMLIVPAISMAKIFILFILLKLKHLIILFYHKLPLGVSVGGINCPPPPLGEPASITTVVATNCSVWVFGLIYCFIICLKNLITLVPNKSILIRYKLLLIYFATFIPSTTYTPAGSVAHISMSPTYWPRIV